MLLPGAATVGEGASSGGSVSNLYKALQELGTGKGQASSQSGSLLHPSVVQAALSGQLGSTFLQGLIPNGGDLISSGNGAGGYPLLQQSLLPNLNDATTLALASAMHRAAGTESAGSSAAAALELLRRKPTQPQPQELDLEENGGDDTSYAESVSKRGERFAASGFRAQQGYVRTYMYKKPTTVTLSARGQLKEPCFQFMRRCFPRIQHRDWVRLQIEKNGQLQPQVYDVQHVVQANSAQISRLQACLEGMTDDVLGPSLLALGWGQLCSGNLVLLVADPTWLKQQLSLARQGGIPPVSLRGLDLDSNQPLAGPGGSDQGQCACGDDDDGSIQDVNDEPEPPAFNSCPITRKSSMELDVPSQSNRRAVSRGPSGLLVLRQGSGALKALPPPPAEKSLASPSSDWNSKEYQNLYVYPDPRALPNSFSLLVPPLPFIRACFATREPPFPVQVQFEVNGELQPSIIRAMLVSYAYKTKVTGQAKSFYVQGVPGVRQLAGKLKLSWRQRVSDGTIIFSVKDANQGTTAPPALASGTPSLQLQLQQPSRKQVTPQWQALLDASLSSPTAQRLINDKVEAASIFAAANNSNAVDTDLSTPDQSSAQDVVMGSEHHPATAVGTTWAPGDPHTRGPRSNSRVPASDSNRGLEILGMDDDDAAILLQQFARQQVKQQQVNGTTAFKRRPDVKRSASVIEFRSAVTHAAAAARANALPDGRPAAATTLEVVALKRGASSSSHKLHEAEMQALARAGLLGLGDQDEQGDRVSVAKRRQITPPSTQMGGQAASLFTAVPGLQLLQQQQPDLSSFEALLHQGQAAHHAHVARQQGLQSLSQLLLLTNQSRPPQMQMQPHADSSLLLGLNQGLWPGLENARQTAVNMASMAAAAQLLQQPAAGQGLSSSSPPASMLGLEQLAQQRLAQGDVQPPNGANNGSGNSPGNGPLLVLLPFRQ